MEIKVNNNTHCRQPGLVLPVIVLMLLISSATQAATTFHVTTTADNGDNVNPTSGSLRKAIIDAQCQANSACNLEGLVAYQPSSSAKCCRRRFGFVLLR